jgi:hypothetical protein
MKTVAIIVGVHTCVLAEYQVEVLRRRKSTVQRDIRYGAIRFQERVLRMVDAQTQPIVVGRHAGRVLENVKQLGATAPQRLGHLLDWTWVGHGRMHKFFGALHRLIQDIGTYRGQLSSRFNTMPHNAQRSLLTSEIAIGTVSLILRATVLARLFSSPFMG